MSFVHLHTHSHYSLLDGLAKIDDLISEALALGMNSLALTDHGNMHGAVEFYKKSKKAGLKPIIGMEAYLAKRKLTDKQPNIDDKRYHLVLLAENNQGYKNLMKLATVASLEGFYYKPRIDKEILRKHSQGLIALSSCLSGEIPRALLNRDQKKARDLVLEYQEIFGRDSFFIELEHHPNIPNHQKIQKELLELARKTNTPIVAAQDIHYLKPEDAHAQDVLLAIQTNTKLDDEDRLTMKQDDFSMRSPEEMKKFFKDTPEAVENTLAVAERCDIKLELDNIQFPHFPVPDNHTAESYIGYLCQIGLEKRFGKNPAKEIKDRCQYELEVIKRTGFAPYFLIVQDFVNWAKDSGIVVGPGRGSAAGSLVSYLLNITNIDPIKYGLIFERFINPERISPPDIDLDFADTRRDEVLKYVSQKYGENHVAQIITFGTMAARAAIRDAGRALGLAYGFCDQIAKMIPFGFSLNKAAGSVSELKEIFETQPDAQRLIETAKKMEGVARHASVHACGVVITKDPLFESVPLQVAVSKNSGEKKQSIVTQYGMHSIEDLGLLKMDLLGLKNLSIIESVVKLIEKNNGRKIDIDKIPFDDPEVFKTMAEGKTIGIFQLEGGGMTNYLKQLKPTDIEDIIAMVALYRPGPMELIPVYIKRKHGLESISYLHPKMESALKNTYGIMIYQEQLMQIARDLAGFTMAEADILRKAVGKKIKKLLDEQKEKFRAGVIKNTGSTKLADELWKLIEPFSGYGFNRSHAACYAVIAYQTAYLKTHWPLEFMASLMNADEKDAERMALLVKECQKIKIKVLPPNLNSSDQNFTPYKQENSIRFGLRAIKNVGHNVVEAIIQERNSKGFFQSFSDFLDRLPIKEINKKSLEALIKSGALDELGERRQLLENLPKALEYHKENARANHHNQSSLFGLLEDKKGLPELRLAKTEPAAPEEKLRWEKELIGLYISGHPLEKYRKQLEKQKIRIQTAKNLPAGSPVLMAGMIEEIKKIATKKGEPMLFLRLFDFTDNIEAVVFPRILAKYGHLIALEKVIFLKGAISKRNGNVGIICDEIRELGN
ncbi:MAG: polymerase III alpha subunit protein [Parcubacteria group bacterium GW2011_GWB1_41_6]|nr:MAG: polymerase III alpha subunit protein [Parcubacteria group bacterium GW2011_GWB1_41_6]KKS56702.1 MAG: polymerase III alpha subunit protein [Parcubacteria group bacterium GW2011_GWA2_42_35]